MRYQPTPKETREQILKLREEGLTIESISTEVGVAPSTAHNIIRQALGNSGIPEHFTKRWYDEQKRMGKTEQQIAKELFISHSTLLNWKKKLGWKIKKKNQRPNAGRKPLVDLEDIINLIETEGYNYETTANIVGISSSSVRKRYKQYALVD